jgi:hypothetical protein
MEGTLSKGRLFDWVWFLAWAIGSSMWCLSAGHQLGATFDEPLYIRWGMERWHSGSYRPFMRAGTMPLAIDVETLPLNLYERYKGSRIDLDRDWEWALSVSRAAALVFWWALLFYAWRLSRLLGGTWSGRLAIAAIACEPNMLAHAALATTDIAVSAGLLGFVYYYRTGRHGGWFHRIGLPMAWFALALLAKASALVFVPLCILALEVERWWQRRVDGEPGVALWTSLWTMRRDTAWIGFGALVLVFLYVGSDWTTEPTFIGWAKTLDGTPGRAILWTAEHLRIFSNAGEGLVQQIKHNVRGHGVYLLGRTADRAFWYYFPVLLSIKLTVPLLVGAIFLACARPRSLGNSAALIAVLLLAFSLIYRVQIGIRLLLPAIVLAIIGLAAAAANVWRTSTMPWRRAIMASAAISIGWMVLVSARAWPNGLSYINELWGGTARGPLLVSDSNYDWGQGLKDLSRWQRHHHIDVIDLWYYGTDPMLGRLPLRPVPFHALPLAAAGDVLPHVQGHYLAVSTTLLYGSVATTPGSRKTLEFLRAHAPSDRTPTFFIYDFTRSTPGSSIVKAR